MTRKIIIGLIIISYLSYVGCYSNEFISKEEIINGEYQVDHTKDIFINTDDFSRYHFISGYYHFLKDSIYGEGSKLEAGQKISFKGVIPVDEISSIEQEQVDEGSSVGLVLGIVAIGVVVAGIIVLALVSDAVNPD
jgi:hypothetical protein